MRWLCISAAVCIIMAALTGASADPQKTGVEQLLKKRTAVMDSILSRKISHKEGFSQLKEIEEGGLYSDDIRNLNSYRNSDCDRILSMKVKNMKRESHVADLMTFNCDIVWTCSGYEGIYTETGNYSVGATETGNGLKLVSFQLLK